jgi:hypothetical protein
VAIGWVPFLTAASLESFFLCVLESYRSITHLAENRFLRSD